jgi:type II secretory pathway pseudopilin PulG
MLKPRRLCGRRNGQSGMSIVELMVGIAVGLMVTAAATLLMSGQLVENRRLVTETQMQQDLRAATDIMTREVRRSGSDTEILILSTIWYPGRTDEVTRNASAEGLATSAGQVDYAYNPEKPGSSGGPYAYRKVGSLLRADLAGNSSWQDLTDANIMNVTAFTPQILVEPTLASVVLPCPKLCPGGGIACWPTVNVRLVTMAVTAEAKRDATVQRAISSASRIRSDRIAHNNSITVAGLPTPQLCPI